MNAKEEKLLHPDDSVANQSTTIGNTTSLTTHRLNDVRIIDVSNINNMTSNTVQQQYHIPAVLRRAKEGDQKKDFHQKLQVKLDTLIKKKDYQLMLDLTKKRIVQRMSTKQTINDLQLMKKHSSVSVITDTAANSEPHHKVLHKSKLKNLGRSSKASPIHPLSPTLIPSSQLSEVDDREEHDDEDGDQELQHLIAEGEGANKKKRHQISYVTGTKSTLCRRFVKLGQCLQGDKCEYAHSKKELQFNSPQEWVQLVKSIGEQTRQQEVDVTFKGAVSVDAKYLGEKMGVNGTKTLMEACKLDDYRGVEFLLKNGANPIIQDFNGYDALYFAVMHNSLKSLHVLMAYGGDRMPLDRTYGKKKRGILTIAAIYSHDIRIMEYLLDSETHGVRFNPNQTDRFQRNAIFYSLFRNNLRAVQLFITVSQCNLDIPDLKGFYLIDYALRYHYVEILLELVKSGARLGIKQAKGVQIMMYAAETGNLELIKALMAKNVPLTSLSEKTGYNCLMTALQAEKYDLIYQLSDYIINAKPFNQQCRDYGETVLMKALAKGKIEVAQQILNKNGVQLGLKDHLGKTELIHAVERNSAEGVKLVIEAGQRLGQDIDMNNYDKRGRTALIHACINQNVEILKILLFDYQFPTPTDTHVVRWKDELGKDVCEYAAKDQVKFLLADYIERNNLAFPSYFTMMQGLVKKSKKQESYLSKVGNESVRRRQVLDAGQVKLAAMMENQRQKTLKNKLKIIEDEIDAENERLKISEKDQVEHERILVLQELSKQRLKQLRSIAIRFPKLTNIELNPKFRQAVTKLYQESDLSKYKTKDKRRSVLQIIENHSPCKVIERYQTKKLSGKLSHCQTESRIHLPSIKSEQDQDEDWTHVDRTVNVKRALSKIFSTDQLLQFKRLTQSLDRNLAIESDRDRDSESDMYSNKPHVYLPRIQTIKSIQQPRIQRLLNKKAFKCDDSELEQKLEEEAQELLEMAQNSHKLERIVKQKITQNFES